MVQLSDPVLVGRSQAFNETVHTIERVARTDAPVLIQGEAGTGKELAARAIHYRGARRERPFVPINCGAIPETLIESELLGHAGGAFSDARYSQQGLLAMANGGTVFLDEVDSLSPKGQVTLLRFLQDHTYRPLGSRQEERADVRVLAATSARLQELMARKQFRVDLFYRLQILLLAIPPLRDRHGDVMLLAQHFASRLSARYGIPERRIQGVAERWLDAYGWPGNVRELENFIHREFLLGSGPEIVIAPERLGFAPATGDVDPAHHGLLPANAFRRAKAQAIEAFERSYIARVLRESRGNVSLAARMCGKERRAFGKLLKKYSIDRGQFTRDA
jgi:two-component system, NtrC family, response regulator GlrR